MSSQNSRSSRTRIRSTSTLKEEKYSYCTQAAVDRPTRYFLFLKRLLNLPDEHINSGRAASIDRTTQFFRVGLGGVGSEWVGLDWVGVRLGPRATRQHSANVDWVACFFF